MFKVILDDIIACHIAKNISKLAYLCQLPMQHARITSQLVEITPRLLSRICWSI